jgi:hypothetical protein
VSEERERLDFSTMEVLPSPARSRERPWDALMRLCASKARRRKRKPSKAHGTNKERSHIARKKAAASAHNACVSAAARRRFHESVRAYWEGERETHP